MSIRLYRTDIHTKRIHKKVENFEELYLKEQEINKNLKIKLKRVENEFQEDSKEVIF